MRRLLPLLLLAATPAAAQDRVFDSHVHIWNGEASVREYLAQLKRDRQTMTRFGAINMAVQGEADRTRARNDELFALAVKYPRLLPIPSVHPYDGTAAIDELRRLKAKGARIIKLHPHTQKFGIADPRAVAVCREAGVLGIVVLIDNANILPGDSEKLFNLALDLPGTKFIFAHMGGFNFRFWNVLHAIRTADGLFAQNIWFDIAAMAEEIGGSPLAAEYVWTMRNVGIDHILIGADYPQFSLKQNVDGLMKLPGLTDAERRAILYDNAAKLLTDGK